MGIDYHKLNQFEWLRTYQTTFNILKEMLISGPLMEPPDWSFLFEIMYNASYYAIGAVLGQ